MPTTAREEYLSGQVMTATPQQRQVMLIEAAIRFAQQAKSQWELGDDEAAGLALIRGQEIVGELLAARAAAETPLGRQSSSVYVFVLRALIEAHMAREPAKVDDALRILEIERATWKAVCRRIGDSVPRAAAPGSQAASDRAGTSPLTAGGDHRRGEWAGGPRVSFEA